MIVIIDYKMGNLTSVARAFEAVGAEAKISATPEAIRAADAVVLPGVGAYAEGIRNLKDLRLDSLLKEEVLQKKKPFLGICLGMQLLSSVGFEHGENAGLGWIPGKTARLEAPGLRLPHIGWNDIRPVGTSPLLEGIPQNTDYYFVHSYAFAPDDKTAVIANCEYGQRFAAAVQSDNVFGVQFHPEKSNDFGLKILKNFAEITCLKKG